MKTLFRLVFILAVPLMLLVGCMSDRPGPVKFGGTAQGTYYAVTYFDEGQRDFQQDIDSILAKFDQSVSAWEPQSVLSKVNNNDPDVIPDEWFVTILERSIEVARETNGAFDFTVGPLAGAWGFGASEREQVDTALVDSLLQYVGYWKVSFDSQKVVKESPGIKLDFNAIAQGYSVDLVGKFLESKGIRNYLVDIGGEVLAKGKKPGDTPWLVGIEKPSDTKDDSRVLQTKVKLRDKALATSGNYRKYYEINGIRYSHSIDPTTGYPVDHTLLSVSVLADDCMSADAYATAFMIMGKEKAMQFLSGRDDLEAYFIYSGPQGSFEISKTKGFEKLIFEE